jgi:predicted DNA-binding transcriptional regulator YafY
MKLYNIIKEIILEVSLDQVVNSVKNKNVATIYYDGEDNGGKGLRVIEPFCVGVSKKGNRVIRAWEREGASKTASTGEQPLPGWRLFRLDKILMLKPTGEVYNEPRSGYNFNGDKSMVNVIINAKFDNNPLQNVA